MKSIWKWILLGLGTFLVVFLIAFPLLGGWSVFPARTVNGYGLMHAGMMGWGGFGGFGLLIGAAAPILLIAGVAALVYFLIKGPEKPQAVPPALPTTPCAYCGKPLDPGWVACPYCGKKTKK
jgi:hypothetical protein